MILLCFLYASSDEIHQLFVPGRSGSFIDILLDTFGSSCAIVFLERK
jgi:VanZ family protein